MATLRWMRQAARIHHLCHDPYSTTKDAHHDHRYHHSHYSAVTRGFPPSWPSAVAKRHRHQFPHMATHLHVHPFLFRQVNNVRRCHQRARRLRSERRSCATRHTRSFVRICTVRHFVSEVSSHRYSVWHEGHAPLLGTSGRACSGMAGRTAGQSRQLETVPPFAECFCPEGGARRNLGVRGKDLQVGGRQINPTPQ